MGMEVIDVVVNGRKPVKPFYHFYAASGYANTDYTYTGPSMRMYDYLSSYHNHPKFMRMHNILTSHGKGDYYLLRGEDYGNQPATEYPKEDVVVSINKDGQLAFNWSVVDKVYDILIEHGMRPVVETVYLPSCLQVSQELDNVPRDYEMWRKVIEELVLHVQERYGVDEVEKWYFEIWNEPDTFEYWLENPETFYALYDYMENAIHSINPKIKVGGPATMQFDKSFILFRGFLNHCARGVNYATGTIGSRVDFLSVHCKAGRPESIHPAIETMFDPFKLYLDIVKEYPEFRNTEIMSGEADPMVGGNRGIRQKNWLNFRNTHYFPGFVCKMIDIYCNLVEDEYNMNLGMVISDNCHLQWEKFLFSGNRSQLTPLCEYPSSDLIKKSVFNAHVLLSRLGNQRLHVECKNGGFRDKFGVLPTALDDMFSIMVWNFEDGADDSVNDRKIRLTLEGLNCNGVPSKTRYRMVHYRIDRYHSNPQSVWAMQGKPSRPTVDQIKMIREREGLELYTPVKDIEVADVITMELDMPMHAISLLLLIPYIPYDDEKPTCPAWLKGLTEEGFNGNPQVFLKWRPCPDKTFLHYRIWRRKDNEADFVLINDSSSTNTATYIDMDVERGHSYFYSIQAVNVFDAVSEMSEIMEVEVM